MDKEIKPLTSNNGTIYRFPHTMDYYVLPRTEFLLHHVKKIEEQLIQWCKVNKYSQGDSYSVRVTSKGKWAVSYSNDYPLQHGSGQEFVLTEEEFRTATI